MPAALTAGTGLRVCKKESRQSDKMRDQMPDNADDRASLRQPNAAAIYGGCFFPCYRTAGETRSLAEPVDEAAAL